MPKQAPLARWCSECVGLTDHLTKHHKGHNLVKAIFEVKPSIEPEENSEPGCTHKWVLSFDASKNKEVFSCFNCGVPKPLPKKKAPAPKLNPKWEVKAPDSSWLQAAGLFECKDHQWKDVTKAVGSSLKTSQCTNCGQMTVEVSQPEKVPTPKCEHSWADYTHLEYQDLYVSHCFKCGEKKAVPGEVAHKKPGCQHLAWKALDYVTSQCVSCGMKTKTSLTCKHIYVFHDYDGHLKCKQCYAIV